VITPLAVRIVTTGLPDRTGVLIAIVSDGVLRAVVAEGDRLRLIPLDLIRLDLLHDWNQAQEIIEVAEMETLAKGNL